MLIKNFERTFEFFYKLKLRFLNSLLPFLKLKLWFLNLKLRFLNLVLSFLNLKLRFLNLVLSFLNLNLKWCRKEKMYFTKEYVNELKDSSITVRSGQKIAKLQYRSVNIIPIYLLPIYL